jgi:hypothetical protein
MKSDSPGRSELTVLEEMAAVYQDSRGAFVDRNLPAIETATARLEALSAELGRFLVRTPTAELLAARARVHALNLTFAAFSRRALQTTGILLNIVAPATGGIPPVAPNGRQLMVHSSIFQAYV